MKKLVVVLVVATLLLSGVAFGHAALLALASPPSHAGRTIANPAKRPYGITITGLQFTRTSPGPAGTRTAPADFQQLGVTWVRVQMRMSDLFPPDSGSLDPTVAANYNWSLLDQALLDAHNNHLLVDFPLQGVPNLIYNGQPFQDSCADPTAYVLNAYSSALMSHLRNDLFVQHPEVQGTMRAIEIGNEDWSFSPNGPNCVNSASVYAQIVEHVTPTIRSLSSFMTPRPLIGTFGYTNFGTVNDPAPTHSVSTFWQGFYGYRATSADRGPAHLIDFANFHYYHDNVNPTLPISAHDPNHPTHPHGHDTFQTVYQAIEAAGANYRNHSGKSILIWVTETGWTLTGCNQNPNLFVTASQQSSYEQIMLDESRLSKGVVTNLFLFTADEYTTSCGYNGMDISNDGNWQPAATMLHNYILTYPVW